MYESNEKMSVNMHELQSKSILKYRIEKYARKWSQKVDKVVIKIFIKNIGNGIWNG